MEQKTYKKKMFERGPSYSDLFLFFLKLSLYYSTGSSPLVAVNALTHQTENKVLQQTLKDMSKDLSTGGNLSAAFSKHTIFPKFCGPIVLAGEASGELGACLEEISYDMEQNADIIRRLFSAVLPVLIGAVFITIAFFLMMFFVIPYLQQLYDGMNIPLPGITIAMINVFKFGSHYWYVFLLLLLLLLWAGKQHLIKHPDLVDQLLLKIPIYKHIHYSLLQYKFTKIFRLLSHSGIGSMQAIEYTADAIGNEVMARMLRKTAHLMKSGFSLPDALERNNNNKILDVAIINLIKMGEDNGATSLVQGLEKAAGFYKKELDANTQTFGTKITPFFLIPAFAVAIVIILAIEYPMLMMTQGV
jgi:type II secretory pathway component PulF